jgi:hypothetical protein
VIGVDLGRDFSAQQKHRELMREIGQRENVYPRLVASGRVGQAAADRQLAIMRAIARDYANRHQMLFGEAL